MAQSRYYSATAQPTVLTTNITPSQNTIQVQQTVGFPLNTPYILALDYNTPSEEIVLVTVAAGNTLTVTRGYDGTAATSHNVNGAVRHTWTAMDGNDSRNHESLSAGVHGVTGNVVGTTDTQTLTNKTLTSPILSGSVTLNSPTINGTVAGSATYTTPTLTTPTINGAAVSGTITGNSTFSSTTTFSSGIVGGSSGQFFVNASGNITTTGIGQYLFARKTADQTVTSTTNVNDADLVLAMQTNATYVIDGEILYATTAAADFVIGRTIPASTNCFMAVHGLSAAFTSDTGQIRMVGATNSTATTTFTLDAGGTSTTCVAFRGLVITGATPGNFQFNWGQSISTAANTTLFANSYITLRRVA